VEGLVWAWQHTGVLEVAQLASRQHRLVGTTSLYRLQNNQLRGKGGGQARHSDSGAACGYYLPSTEHKERCQGLVEQPSSSLLSLWGHAGYLVLPAPPANVKLIRQRGRYQ